VQEIEHLIQHYELNFEAIQVVLSLKNKQELNYLLIIDRFHKNGLKKCNIPSYRNFVFNGAMEDLDKLDCLYPRGVFLVKGMVIPIYRRDGSWLSFFVVY